MEELLVWFRKEKEKAKVNPILLASLFHYRFIRIHPFDDGNGRIARILMNFILMQFGYPPVIIKTEDKENYYAVLRLADADELKPFIEYIAQNLVHSLQIMIKGAKGEDIEELDDLDKELTLLKAKFDTKGNVIKVVKSKEVIRKHLNNTFPIMVEDFLLKLQKFNKFYRRFTFQVNLGTIPKKNELIQYDSIFRESFLDIDKNNIQEYCDISTLEALRALNSNDLTKITSFEFIYEFDCFYADLSDESSFVSTIGIWFHEKILAIYDKNNICPLEVLYSDEIIGEQLTPIIQEEIKRHKEHLYGLLETIKSEK